jgi:hypothetical protein
VPRSRRQAGSPVVQATRFSGEITVASRIVDDLSSGLYDSPAACLKELVNNSYDADATEVRVFVKPDAQRIIVEDNGIGMNRSEFEQHFSRISESHKRDVSDTTDLGRPKIGKIGIGFIAANELCNVMVLESTKAGSTDLLRVSINFAEMRRDPAERRRSGGYIAKADYEGELLVAPRDEHYTRIFLEEIRGEAQEVLVGARPVASDAPGPSLYGLSAETVAKRLRDPTLATWEQFDRYSQTLLRVALNVPIKYAPGWIPDDVRDKVRDLERRVAKLNFSVSYDGTELRKPAVFSGDVPHLVHRFTLQGDHVSAEGYFYLQHGTLRPSDLNGVLIRIRHAAVGEYRSDFLGFPSSTGQLFRRWISAEVWADDRLEEALNIDRRTLRVTHPAYVELQDAFHREFAEALSLARTELYEKRSQSRRQSDTRKELAAVESIVRTAGLPERASAGVRATWQEAAKRPTRNRPLLRKYSVSEMYDIVLDVARDVMTPAQFQKFVTELTKRLAE